MQGSTGHAAAENAAMARMVSEPKFRKQEDLIQKAIIEEPTIEDSSNLSVYIKNETGGAVIHVLGKTVKQADKRRVLDLVNEHRQADQTISDEIVVSR